MAILHDVALTLGSTGQVCDVWNGYRIELGLFVAGAPWEFRLWRSAGTRSAWDVLAPAVRAGDWVQFAIDGAPQLVAQIDARARGGSRAGAELVIAGRDLAAAAIDAGADPRIHLTDTTLEDAATALLAPLGIRTILGADADVARRVQTSLRAGPRGSGAVRRHRQRVGRFHPKPGETVWGLLIEACRRVGLLCWPTIAADRTLAVVFDVPDYDQPPTYVLAREERGGVVPVGSAILSGTDRVDVGGIPTEVHVCGHAADGDGQAARFRYMLGNGGLFFDTARVAPASTFGARPRWINSHRALGHDQGMQDAARVICDANRKLRRYECTVQGHGQRVQGQMRIFAINTVARVRDTVAGVDEDMLIEHVVFEGQRPGGQTTTLTLHPLNAVQLVPAPG